MAYTEREERKKAFIVFASTYEATKYLTREQKGELFELLGKFAFNDEEVHSESPLVDMLLRMTIPNMIAAEKRHQIAIENGSKGKDFGIRGGRPRKNLTKVEVVTTHNKQQLPSNNENNPQITPNKPLNSNTNINKEVDNNIDKNIDKYIDKNIDRYIERYIERNREKKSDTNSYITNLVRDIIDKQREDKEPSYLNVSDSELEDYEGNLLSNLPDIEEPTPPYEQDNISPIAIEDVNSNNSRSNNTSSVPISEGIDSGKDPNETSIFDYNNEILKKKLHELADIKKNKRPHNDQLFYQAADLYMYLYPYVNDIKEACKDLNYIIDGLISDDNSSEL